MIEVIFALIFMGDTINFSNDASREEFTELLNADANPRMEFKCELYDESGREFALHFVQTGGYPYLKGGYKPGVGKYEAGKTATVTEIIVDETSVFTSDQIPAILDASARNESVKFLTEDGFTTTTISYMKFGMDGPVVVNSRTIPPQISTGDRDIDAERNRYRTMIFDARPMNLVGFCSVDREQQPALTFEEFERFAREAE